MVGKQHEIKGQAIAAFVTLKDGVAATPEMAARLEDHVATKIGAIVRPDNGFFTADLPKTRSGKIMRRLLRDIAEGRALGDTTTLSDPGAVERVKSRYEEEHGGSSMNTHRLIAVAALAGGLALGASVRPAAAQWQIDSKDGKASLKIGVLAQPELEVIDTPDGTGESKNVFLRRLRVLFGGKLSDKWTFFVETDSPNLGKTDPNLATDPTGAKDAGNIYIQDAYLTYTQNSLLMVDTGLILVPLSHNHNQSAATLLPVDYGPYSFTESAPLGSRVGRDYGAEVRGYPLGHFEYRLGVFQGVRGPEARNSFRVAGRVVWYPFAADTGFFYGGTWQGSKRLVALGAGFDTQKQYHSYALDAFVEQPLNGGRQGFTAQVDWTRFDGGTFLTTLPKQDTILVEAALHLGRGKFSPVLQYSRKTFANPLTPDQSIWQAGVAYWMAGFRRNIKVTAGRQHTGGLPDRTQVLAQLQLFYF